MKKKRLQPRGFISINKSELRVRGGTSYDWSMLIRAWALITTFVDVISNYRKDFEKGYNSGLSGKGLEF